MPRLRTLPRLRRAPTILTRLDPEPAFGRPILIQKYISSGFALNVDAAFARVEWGRVSAEWLSAPVRCSPPVFPSLLSRSPRSKASVGRSRKRGFEKAYSADFACVVAVRGAGACVATAGRRTGKESCGWRMEDRRPPFPQRASHWRASQERKPSSGEAGGNRRIQQRALRSRRAGTHNRTRRIHWVRQVCT